MSSYNKLNGTYTSESRELLTDILRDDWQFEGLVMSDWFGGNDAVAMINAGNDLLEPGTKLQWNALKKGAETGSLADTEIDISVSRILRLILGSNKMNNYKYDENPDLEKHAEIARNSANEGIVLLKNNNVLPIQKTAKVALFGITSYDFISGGTGSGDVNEAYSVSLEEGLKNSTIKVNNSGEEIEINQISSEVYQSSPVFIIDDKAKSLYESHKSLNEELFVKPEGINAIFDPYNPPEIAYTEEQIESISKNTDIGIITIGRNSGEGGDRVKIDDFELKGIEKETIKNVASAYHKQDKKVIKNLKLEIINRGLDFKGKFISKDSYKCDLCQSVESNWNNSLFKAGLRTGTWYKEDGVEIYDGDYVFEVFRRQITILSVKDDFETVATISFPGNLGFINFQNNQKNLEQRDVILRMLIASNP